MTRYAITNRILYKGDELQRQAALVCEATRWAHEGIDYIQLREKDLSTAALTALARQILEAIRTWGSTKLLINSRPDVALAAGAHGVHLTASPDQLTPAEVRRFYAAATVAQPVVSRSCHTLEDVHRALQQQADVILFGPVFEKNISGQRISPGIGLDRLRVACAAAAPIPVLALGGVTHENAHTCVEAGAAGIAGIRLFAGN